MKKIVIVGATSAIAEGCARLWLKSQPADLTLVGRDIERINRVVTDLGIRSPQSKIRALQADFLNPDAIADTVQFVAKSGRIDIALIAHGSLPNQAECQRALQYCRDSIEINGLSPIIYAEAFAKEMEKENHGTIVLIGSVAGDRGRKSNYIYGAAKGMVTRYAEGLGHRLSNSNIKVVLIKPGPTDTPMTAHLKDEGMKLASVTDVAKGIVNAVKLGKPVSYIPGKWWLIMKIIRHIPSVIFNKMDI